MERIRCVGDKTPISIEEIIQVIGNQLVEYEKDGVRYEVCAALCNLTCQWASRSMDKKTFVDGMSKLFDGHIKASIDELINGCHESEKEEDE